jgi:hypothetical protein
VNTAIKTICRMQKRTFFMPLPMRTRANPAIPKRDCRRFNVLGNGLLWEEQMKNLKRYRLGFLRYVRDYGAI